MKKLKGAQLLVSLLCLVTSLFSVSLLNADPKKAQELQKLGHQHLQKKEFQQALKYFKDALKEDPYDRNLNFLLGLVSFQLGFYEEALFSYERALAIDPKNVPVLLEKVRVLLAMGAISQAKEDLVKAKTMNLTPELRRSLDRLFSQVSAKKQHEFTGMARLSQLWDSNATLGTETETTIEINETPFKADPTKRSDWSLSILLAGNHSYPLTEQGTWKNSLLFFGSKHDRLKENEIDLISFTTGFGYSIDNRHLFDVSVGASKTNLKKQLYQTARIFNLSYSFHYTPRHIITASYNWNGRTHFALPDATGIDETFGLLNKYTAAYTYISQDGKYIWDLNYSFAFDKAPRPADNANVYRRFQGSAKLTRLVVPEILNLYVSVSRKVDDYREQSVIIQGQQLDRGHTLTLGSNIKISQEFGLKRDWFLDIILSSTYNESNQQQSEYQSQQISWQLTTNF